MQFSLSPNYIRVPDFSKDGTKYSIQVAENYVNRKGGNPPSQRILRLTDNP